MADGKLIDPTEADCAAAWAAYAAGTARDASIVDQVSFAVMRRLGITDVFATSGPRGFTRCSKTGTDPAVGGFGVQWRGYFRGEAYDVVPLSRSL